MQKIRCKVSVFNENKPKASLDTKDDLLVGRMDLIADGVGFRVKLKLWISL